MKMKAITTRHGIIYGRNALLLSSQELNFYPFEFSLKASLSLASCIPEVLDTPDVSISFLFKEIESLSIYKLDDFPHEKDTESCFDEVEGDYRSGVNRIILSTYDYVFDITGKYEVIYN